MVSARIRIGQVPSDYELKGSDVVIRSRMGEQTLWIMVSETELRRVMADHSMPAAQLAFGAARDVQTAARSAFENGRNLDSVLDKDGYTLLGAKLRVHAVDFGLVT